VIVRGLFHLHTTVSKDATLTHEAYVEEARERGWAFLLFAEHREKMTEDEVREAAARCDALSADDLLLVPGQEQQTEPLRLHVCAAGVREPLAEEEPAAAIREIRERGGISVLAHPFRYRRDPPADELVASLDGIEGWNLRYDGRVGVRSEVRELLDRHAGAMAIAGVDAHDPADLERDDVPVLAVDVRRLRETDLLEAVRAGRFEIESGGRPLDLRRRRSRAARSAAAVHRGAFAVLRAARRGLARIGVPVPEGLVRRARRRF
jgi:histidinol phosphatase-like PHP family hydrolase